MMKSKIFTIFFLYCINIVLSQSYYIEGGIFVEGTNKPITNANIRMVDGGPLHVSTVDLRVV